MPCGADRSQSRNIDAVPDRIRQAPAADEKMLRFAAISNPLAPPHLLGWHRSGVAVILRGFECGRAIVLLL